MGEIKNVFLELKIKKDLPIIEILQILSMYKGINYLRLDLKLESAHAYEYS